MSISDPQPQPGPEQVPGPAMPPAPPAPVAAPQPSPVETEPLEYHRLFRGIPRYGWWKPIVALVLGTIFYFTLQTVYLLIVAIAYFTASGEEMTQAGLEALALPDTQRPITLIAALGSIILMIPALWAALWAVGYKPIGRIWSVAGRIRWGWIGRSVLPALAGLAVMNLVGIGLEIVFGNGAEVTAEAPHIDVTAAMWSALILLVLLPLQCTAEELVFRGVLMQSLGSWLRSPWLAIALPAVLFGFSHIYDVWGWCAVVAMALAAGWLTWRTGGLEAAIVLHVINNFVAFGFMTVGFGGQTSQTSDGGGPGALIGEVLGLALYAWLIDRAFTKRDGRRTRIDLVWPRGTGRTVLPPAPAAGQVPPTWPQA